MITFLRFFRTETLRLRPNPNRSRVNLLSVRQRGEMGASRVLLFQSVGGRVD